MLNPADLELLLSPKTRLLAFPHCSNVVGHVNPVADIVSIAKAAGDVYTVVDGVACAPHGLPDIGSLGADIYLFSLYKTWGPHLGVMTIKKQVMDALPNQGHFFNARLDRKKMLPAGPDHAQIAAAAGVTQYLDAVHYYHFPPPADGAGTVGPAEKGRQLKQLFQNHERDLLAKLLTWLKKRSDIRIIGPDEPDLRVPTISILPVDKPMDEVFTALTAQKIMAGQGHFYGVRQLMGMNIPVEKGVLRLSFLHYTTEDEIRQLIDGLSAALD